jgi:predicted Zn-dependent protease
MAALPVLVRTLAAGSLLLASILLPGCAGRAPPPPAAPPDPDAPEISLGERFYAPARQSQGGDFVLDLGAAAYVRDVGAKLASVAERRLPYEFALLDDGVPSAWGLPGGKIALSRGLLQNLRSESELAAVLAREIVHAAARPGTPGIDRSAARQGSIVAVGLGVQNPKVSQLVLQDGRTAAQMVSARYSADAELAADRAAAQLMKRAGYDPQAAVAVQEMLLRLARAKDAPTAEGLFGTQPPSEARVAAVRRIAAETGSGGTAGADRHREQTAGLRAATALFDALTDGHRSLARSDYATATVAARRALAADARSARAHELMGDVELGQKRPDAALRHYAEAIRLQEDYFRPHVQTGIAMSAAGRLNDAEPALRRSLELLPTAPAYHLLGAIAEGRGRTDEALQHYRTAAGTAAEIGRQASGRFVRLDLPRNPARYLQADVQAATDGTLYAVLQNAAPVPLLDLRVRIVRVDGDKVADQTPPFTVTQPLQAGRTIQIPLVRVNLGTPDDVQFFRVIVDSVRAMPQG